MSDTALATTYVRWIWCRAVLHRGWWLVAGVYLVVDARLPASELVLIGVAQAVVALVAEVPAGVVADTLSRTRSLVVSHLLMGVAMISTGLVTDLLPLMATQMLWGCRGPSPAVRTWPGSATNSAPRPGFPWC